LAINCFQIGYNPRNNAMENLQFLLIFLKIIEHGSISSAANALGVSRSSVSKQLATFEAQIGVRLLQRTTRKLTLSELGAEIAESAKMIQLCVSDINAVIDGHQNEAQGLLKVTCSVGIGRAHLIPLLAQFNALYPKVTLQLHLGDRFVDLIKEQFDVAVRVGHLADSSLIARRLGNLTWQVAASPSYLMTFGTPKVPEDLIKHACLFYQNQTSAINVWSFENMRSHKEYTIRVQGPLSINDAGALVDAAIDGMGILLIDKALLKQAIGQGKLVPLLTDYHLSSGYPVYALYPAKEWLPTKTRVFVEFLQKKLGQCLL
jgi:DNA-binding transcriptional LysR family regulator